MSHEVVEKLSAGAAISSEGLTRAGGSVSRMAPTHGFGQEASVSHYVDLVLHVYVCVRRKSSLFSVGEGHTRV